MACVNYYVDDALYGFYLFLIGLLICFILFLYILYMKFRGNNEIKVSDNYSTNFATKIDQRTLLSNNNYYKSKEEHNTYLNFIFYNNFDKWKNINRNYINFIGHVDLSNLFSVNETFIREDIIGYNDLEFHYRNERITGQKYLYNQLLNLLLQHKLITPDNHSEYAENYERKYNAVINEFNYQCDNYLIELRSQAPKGTTESELQSLIAEKFPLKADHLVNEIMNAQSTEVREILLNVQTYNQLSNDDINSLFSMYLNSRRKLDEYLNENKASMKDNIERRLLNLKGKVNEEIISDNTREKEYKERENIFLLSIENTLPDISDADKKNIMDTYRKNTNHIKEQHAAEINRQKELLKKAMEHERNTEMEKKFQSFEKDFNTFSNHADKITLEKSDESLNIYKELKSNIDEAAQVTMSAWDQKEISKSKLLNESFTQSIDTDMTQMEYEMLQQLYHERGLDNYDINGILVDYQQNLNSLKSNMQKEKIRQINKMKNLLNAQDVKNITEVHDGFAVQLEVEEKQREIVKMAMDDQMELPSEMKNKILQDSQCNEINIRNQILSLKIRQQKQMELALAKKMKTNSNLPKPVNDISEITPVDIYEEESKKMDIEKENIILEMRDKLATETKAILTQYEDQICNIMAIYQVSHARNMRQKKNIQTLYDNLYNEISHPAFQENPMATQQVLDQFNNDRSNLERMKSSYEQDQKLRMEKRLEEKKARVASAAGNTIKRRFTDQLLAYKESGVSNAALQIADENLFNRMEKETEKEVKLELTEDKEKFEKSKIKYEDDLEKTLLNKKKEIISRLILITNMSSSQISDKLDEIDPNIDPEIKKSIINNIMKKTNENKKEKTLYQFQSNDNPNEKTKHFTENIDKPESEYPEQRKKKKKRRKIREQEIENEDIENDF